jgi:hypothetical protein
VPRRREQRERHRARVGDELHDRTGCGARGFDRPGARRQLDRGDGLRHRGSPGEPDDVHVRVGEATTFGSLSAVDNAGSAAGPQTVSLPLSGLTPKTMYLYRIVASNADGATAGAVQSFTTEA